MTREQAIKELTELLPEEFLMEYAEAIRMAIKALEQEPCEDVCERFEQSVDIVTDIVEFRFSDGTVKRAKRGLYMRDIEKSLRKMLIDQMANEKKQKHCDDAIRRQDLREPRFIIAENDYQKGWNDALESLYENAPSIQPQQKMGRWIRVDKDELKCSECEVIHYIAQYPQSANINYCPNCGAKMQEIKT